MTIEESFENSMAWAREAAPEQGVPIYVIESKVYADSHHEYDDRHHVEGRIECIKTMTPQRPEFPWKLVAVVQPDGAEVIDEPTLARVREQVDFTAYPRDR